LFSHSLTQDSIATVSFSNIWLSGIINPTVWLLATNTNVSPNNGEITSVIQL
jgi:hypothetical protein